MTKLFQKPAFVYVYIDKNTDLPVYIGKVNAGKSLDSRINQHRHDFWFDDRKQEIYFTPVESSATADMLETALINYYKDQDVPLMNIAKTTWGKSSKISKDDFGWIPYELYNSRLLDLNRKRLESMDIMIRSKERDIHRILKKEELIRHEFQAVKEILEKMEKNAELQESDK